MDFTKTTLGIEFGSTRVKAVLIDKSYQVLAEGVYDWENSFAGGYWTYGHDEILTALQQSFAALSKQVQDKFGAPLTTVGAIGLSAMMHGYIAMDENDRFLVPFRTWRNTTTGEAAEKLTKLFSFNIPERWSVAHLYQAILNGEEHVKDIRARHPRADHACRLFALPADRRAHGRCGRSGGDVPDRRCDVRL